MRNMLIGLLGVSFTLLTGMASGEEAATTTETTGETSSAPAPAPTTQEAAPGGGLVGPKGVTGTIRRSDRRQDRRLEEDLEDLGDAVGGRPRARR